MTNEEAKIILENAIYNHRPVGDSYKAFRMAIETLENCPPKDSICYGCHDNCKKCECQAMLMV